MTRRTRYPGMVPAALLVAAAIMLGASAPAALAAGVDPQPPFGAPEAADGAGAIEIADRDVPLAGWSFMTMDAGSGASFDNDDGDGNGEDDENDENDEDSANGENGDDPENDANAGYAENGADDEHGATGVVCYDRDGVTVFVPLSFVDGGKAYFLGYPYNNYYIKPNPVEFSDAEGHWAAAYIEFITGREVSLGFPDGSFRPDANMTRAMFATILSRLIIADTSEYSEALFSDVDPGSWYGPPVAWAYDYGIVEGIGGGLFNPEGNVTRQDMALMIERFLEAFAIDLLAAGGEENAENAENGEDADYGDGETNKGGAEPFADEDAISFWAVEAVARMRDHSILRGRPGNLFDPKGFSTRAEVATVIYRLVESAIAEAQSRLADDAEHEA